MALSSQPQPSIIVVDDEEDIAKIFNEFIRLLNFETKIKYYKVRINKMKSKDFYLNLANTKGKPDRLICLAPW